MNDFFWHIEEAFYPLIVGPLMVRVFIFSILLGVAIGMTAFSGGGSDDA